MEWLPVEWLSEQGALGGLMLIIFKMIRAQLQSIEKKIDRVQDKQIEHELLDEKRFSKIESKLRDVA